MFETPAAIARVAHASNASGNPGFHRFFGRWAQAGVGSELSIQNIGPTRAKLGQAGLALFHFAFHRPHALLQFSLDRFEIEARAFLHRGTPPSSPAARQLAATIGEVVRAFTIFTLRCF